MRRTIYEILNDKSIDLEKEYSRIYYIFYEEKCDSKSYNCTLCELVRAFFKKFAPNYIGRCISFEDFNDFYGFRFELLPKKISVEYLISFSEYVINFVRQLMLIMGNVDFLISTIKHIQSCMEDIGYVSAEKDSIIIFVEKNPVALSVAETTKPELAYSVLEYNHHLFKGNITEKKNILKNMADDIETNRKELKNINSSFTTDLFQLLNKFIRHDSSENAYISSLEAKELEQIYDEIYQMWLLAKMQLEQHKRNEMISEIIKKINEN